MKSWKTTLCGVLAIVGGGLTQFFHDVPWLMKLGGFLATTAPACGLLFARDNNVTSEQANTGKGIKIGPVVIGLALCGLLVGGCVGFNPKDIKPVPVAAGQDALVVNIERVQASSLEIYRQTTEWELSNRDALPASVSRAVDKLRAEFQPAWEESRRVLKDYEAGKASGADLDRFTAALTAAQESMIRLRADNGAAFELLNDLAKLAHLVAELRN